MKGTFASKFIRNSVRGWGRTLNLRLFGWGRINVGVRVLAINTKKMVGS
jgi:hypothetical protein